MFLSLHIHITLSCPVYCDIVLKLSYPLHCDIALSYPLHCDIALSYPLRYDIALSYPLHCDIALSCPLRCDIALSCPLHCDIAVSCPLHCDIAYPFHCPGISEPVFKGSLRLEDMEWREEYAETSSVQFQRLKRSVESEVSIKNIKGFALCLSVKLSMSAPISVPVSSCPLPLCVYIWLAVSSKCA